MVATATEREQIAVDSQVYNIHRTRDRVYPVEPWKSALADIVKLLRDKVERILCRGYLRRSKPFINNASNFFLHTAPVRD